MKWDVRNPTHSHSDRGAFGPSVALAALVAVFAMLMAGAIGCTPASPAATPEQVLAEAPTQTLAPTPAPRYVVVEVTATPPPEPVPPAEATPPSLLPTPVSPGVSAGVSPGTTATHAPTPLAQPTPVVLMVVPNVADVVERVRPAVVSVLVEVVERDFFGATRARFGSGTGVIITSDGYVITNNHVIEGANKITVTLDDSSQVEAELVGADALSDLAVLRIPGSGHPYLSLNDGALPRVGEWVIAIGNALDLPGGPTVTVGVVSALGRTISAGGGSELYDLVQTDTVINPGNSGGPLINVSGELVGINTVVLRGGSRTGTPIEGIGFAINMETARLVSEQLIREGRVKWAWLGVFLADLTPEVAAEFGLPIREGVIIRHVMEGSPAFEAGIVPGDIVMSMGGQETPAVVDLLRLLRTDFRVGEEAEAEIFSNGSRRTVRMLMGERPSQ